MSFKSFIKELFWGYLIGAELDNGNVEGAKDYISELSKHNSDNQTDK